MADTLVLPRPDDFHAHFRSGELAAAYAARHALSFGRALAMPNTLPPIASAGAMLSYRDGLHRAAPDLEILMTFKLLPGMGAKAVLACAAAGAAAGKYYPAGATTNAQDGVPSPSSVQAELEAMEEAGLVLSIHGEDP
ncbi:MAG: dihydroorotase, partial [Spirochaetaceae bacterium]|nr:dihydroorotase [Spirochaetaceae bacterium]